MKKHKKLLIALLVLALSCVTLAVPAFAVTEEEVQAAVASQGKEVVTGNVFVWFMCAVAFLKASQKIDSFMASLGINVGHTGGSMLGEAMIAARGIGMMSGGKLHGRGIGASIAGKASGHTGSSVTDAQFLHGGAFGAAQRQIARGAVQSATTGGSGLSSAIGGAAFVRSLSKGGKFAADVTGAIAHGRIGTSGSLTGEKAARALSGYIPQPAVQAGGAAADTTAPPISSDASGLGAGMEDAAVYSNVEIGGGRITGYETPAGGTEATQFAMYAADQYAQPDGAYQTVTAIDGSKWYKQYAEAAVKRTPYKEIQKGGQTKVLSNETIVQQLPKPPQRKEKL